MSQRLKADWHVRSVYDVPLSFFKANGIRWVLSDLDNTIEPYTVETPSPRAIAFGASLAKEGIHFALVSNSVHTERLLAYAKAMKAAWALGKAGKPFARRVKAMLAQKGIDPKTCLMVGDQLFTDRVMAHGAKVRFLLADPLSNQDQFFTKFNRLLERPIREKWKRKGLLGPDAAKII